MLNSFYEKLELQKEEFSFQFQSHPNYPSALAFSDTLNFLGVQNEAYELEKEYWEELPHEFITLYKNEFALIQKKGKTYNVITNKEEKVSFQELTENTQDFVLLFDRQTDTQNHKTQDKKLTQWAFFSFSFFVLVMSMLTKNGYYIVYSLISISGLYIFLEIFQNKFGTTSVALQTFCGGGNKNSSKEDACQKVFKSKEFQFLGLNFSDFGLFYFVALTFLGLLIPYQNLVFPILSGLSVLGVVYSVFYQIKNKVFCKVCALVIAILVGQILLAFGFSSFDLNSIFSVETLPVIAILLISFFAVWLANKTLSEKDELRKQNMKNLRFKRNYELFKTQLLTSEKINFRREKEVFYFGEKDAPLLISLVSNPYCGYCKAAHEIVEKIRKKYPQIGLQIRFNYFEEDEKHEEYKTLISDFAYLQKNKSEEEFLSAVGFWFENRNLSNLQTKYNVERSSQNMIAIYEMAEENKQNGLTFTPIILINGYQFPQSYEREDIFYFIDDLLEDEDI